jgi:hypothetical protein
MGFYYASKQHRPTSDGAGPVITPREYVALLACAMRGVIGPQASDTRPGVAETAAASDRLEDLSQRVRRHPREAAAHRMLAIAHLQAGNRRSALRHLEIAVSILLAQAALRGCLHRSLSARLELARLIPVLIPLCLQLGKRDTVRRLLGEVLLAW